jgi:hypothetical protein
MPDANWTADYDALLDTQASRASRLIDRVVKKWPGYFAVSADETRYFDGSGEREQWVDELAAAPTSVLVAESGVVDGAGGTGGTYTAWAASDYFPWPYNAIRLGQPFRRLDIDQLNGTKSIWTRYPKSVKVIGKFGYATTAGTPEEITQASIVQVVRWLQRGRQGFQDAGAIKELGQLQYVQKLDPDIELVVLNFMETTI